ncbi:Rab-GTPase-TBC domain protein [Kalmanozyma brasiliensis GHG001]|uniref:Rab-GTPase-TBC domain protein n=1 Tax=Kalmanozyma brasiliensis (strain GHG001) TaxID=1365824 RepID=UPI00286826C7|nr:Rab-GTPase-TBC domain protein [Kalmanozyma brasiliensis GHG001]EST08234.2 Rab-GTPase-TBC domain protein [Kalmanozyma brasiliensis GHG001]
MSSATVEEFVELLNAEQHVDLQKLRDLARHGVQPSVRGEVWLYLLGVLSDDKGQEMTSVRSKFLAYEALDKHNPALEKRVRSECQRYYQKRLGTRPPPGRTLMRSSRSVLSRKPSGFSAGGLGSSMASGSSLGRDFSMDGSSSSGSLSISGSSMGDAQQSSILGAGASSLATTTLNGSDRGPNRVNDGRIHALGGIIGESGVSAAMDADDPDAAAALELKRFGRSVENIICAFMNRCTAAEASRRKASHGAAESTLGETGTNGSSTAQIADVRHVEDARGRGQTSREAQPGSMAPDGGPTNASTDDMVAVGSSVNPSSARQVHGNGHSSGTSSRSRSRAGSFSGATNGTGLGTPPARSNVSLEDAVRSRMPREYEWQPQVNPGNGGSPGTAAEFHPALVYLCAPFVQCVRVEAGMYFAFERLMMLMARHSARNPLPRQVATFLTLFRTTLPELHSYFEEEEVDIIGFATNWLQHLLAGELRIEDLMRLWDTYFALPDFLDLHLYVCIAILTNCKDSLEELDRSETRSMLDSLPPLDIDRIINEAINIRLSHQRSQRTDDV